MDLNQLSPEQVVLLLQQIQGQTATNTSLAELSEPRLSSSMQVLLLKFYNNTTLGPFLMGIFLLLATSICNLAC